MTVGSPLTGSLFKTPYAAVATVTNSSLPEASANVTSPISGVIVSWRIADAEGGPFYLRVLRPGAGGTYTAVGKSSPGTPSGLGIQTFATNLPIQAGDAVGIDNTKIGDTLGEVLMHRAMYPGCPARDGGPRLLLSTSGQSRWAA